MPDDPDATAKIRPAGPAAEDFAEIARRLREIRGEQAGQPAPPEPDASLDYGFVNSQSEDIWSGLACLDLSLLLPSDCADSDPVA